MSEKSNSENSKKSSIFARLKKVKHIEIIIAVLFIAIIMLIYFISFPSDNKTSQANNPLSTTTFASYAQENESKLKQIVSGIKGAGNSEVMINYESTPELVIAYVENNTQTTSGDSSSSTSNSTPSTINNNGSQSPIVIKELAPKVIGILIIAEGAGNPTVKLEIINAVSTLFGVGTDKIAVLEKSN